MQEIFLCSCVLKERTALKGRRTPRRYEDRLTSRLHYFTENVYIDGYMEAWQRSTVRHNKIQLKSNVAETTVFTWLPNYTSIKKLLEIFLNRFNVVSVSRLWSMFQQGIVNQVDVMFHMAGTTKIKVMVCKYFANSII